MPSESLKGHVTLQSALAVNKSDVKSEGLLFL